MQKKLPAPGATDYNKLGSNSPEFRAASQPLYGVLSVGTERVEKRVFAHSTPRRRGSD